MQASEMQLDRQSSGTRPSMISGLPPASLPPAIPDEESPSQATSGSGSFHARRMRQRLLVLALLLSVALLAMSSERLHGFLIEILVYLEPLVARHPVAGAIAFAALAAASALLAFFSSALLLPMAVHAWGEGTTALLLWVGWLVGGMGAYAAGRWLGQPLARRLAGEERLAFYQSRLGRETPFGVVLLLHLALQSEIPGLVLGTVGYRFRLFLLASGLAQLPYAVGAVYLGSFVLERRTLPLLAGGLLAAGAAFWAVRALNRALRAVEREVPGWTDGSLDSASAPVPHRRDR